MEGLAAAFAELEDPRRGNAKRHLLWEVLMIALCAVLSGGESCADMALFGQLKESFLRQFLTLPHGVPSHDTFSRVFRLLDPEQFRACFAEFMQRFAESCQGVVAIDGKTLRRSLDTAVGASPLHMVSAWGCEQRLVLGQLAPPQSAPAARACGRRQGAREGPCRRQPRRRLQGGRSSPASAT